MTAVLKQVKDVVLETGSPLPEEPYRGLEPFRFIDHPIFFARTKEIRKLSRYVTIYRGVLFYGDSGSGKSSLINAGLIPAILSEGFTPDRIRVQPRAGEEIIVERIPTKNVGAPPYLPSNFDHRNDETAPARTVLAINDLKEKTKSISQSNYPLLIFDQFEELITLFEESSVGSSLADSLKLQSSILDVLVDLLSDHTLAVKLLFVFREDYLAKLTKFFVRCPDLPDQYQRLTAPTTEFLYHIIRGPFDKFPGAFKNELTEPLARRLAAEIESGSQAENVNLSEVQIACVKLWNAGNPESLLEKRKVSGLLEDYLSESLNNLLPELRAPAVALLTRMVTSSKTRNVISEDDLIYLVRKEDKIPETQVRSALGALVNKARLVRTEHRQNTTIYQLVSEFLIPWVSRQKEELRARLIRRRAYKYISISIVIAVAMGLLAWWVYATRTKAALAIVLKEEAVKEAVSKMYAAEIEKEKQTDETERLRRILAGDTSKADINEVYKQRDQYQKQLKDTVGQLTIEQGKLTALDSTFSEYKKAAESAKKEQDIVLAAATKQTEFVMGKLKESNDNNERLEKEKIALKDELNRLKGGKTLTTDSNKGTGETGETEPNVVYPHLKVQISGYTPNEKQRRELGVLVSENNVSPAGIGEGANRIRKQLQENGYFFAQATPQCTVTPPLAVGPNGTPETCYYLKRDGLGNKTVNVTYDVDIGRRFTLTDIRIGGTDMLSYQQVAKQLLSTKASFMKRGFTSLEALEHDAKVIKDRMYELGYTDAKVDVRQSVTPNGEKLVITFVVTKGDLKRPVK